MKKLFILCNLLFFFSCSTSEQKSKPLSEERITENIKTLFVAPDTSELQNDEWGKMVKYGVRLIQNTNQYLGPEGTVSKNFKNKMTCTNCHLNNGTKPFGLNFFNSHKTYPQYRGRENMVLSLADRVNNCITRPMGGTALPLDSKEMTAMISYMKWLGEKYDPEKHEGYGLKDIKIEGMASSSVRGEKVYQTHCKRCHSDNGEGQMDATKSLYIYPPLWGENSYQEASSMHRVLKAAKFIKYNMPNDSSKDEPLLSDQQALDVAAFINNGKIHPRPKSKYEAFPNLSTKTVDFFKGPYLDGFPDSVHTFGPWDEIIAYYKKNGLKVHY